VHQLWRLVEQLGDRLVSEKVGLKEGNQVGDVAGRWFPLRIKNHFCYVAFISGQWNSAPQKFSSPLWLEIHGINKISAPHESFKSEMERIALDDKRWRFPLHIPIGKDKEDVLASLIDQVVRITNHLVQ